MNSGGGIPQDSYTNGISVVQSVGSGLNATPVIISQSLWRYAEFSRSLNEPSPNPSVDSLACLIIDSQKAHGATPSPLNISTVLQFIRNVQENGSNASLPFPPTLQLSDELINESLSRVNNFVSESGYVPPSPSTFEVTLQRIEQLFGGAHWSKEAFGKDIVPVAIGVVNDMYRSPVCTSHHPDHWAFAAIHYAICSYLAEEHDKTDITETWELWLGSGVRWWINFEHNKDIPKFDPFPILTELLDNVYTHIDKNGKICSMLFHPLLRIFEYPKEPSSPENQTTLYNTVTNQSVEELLALLEDESHNLLESRYDGATALFLAAEMGSMERVRALLDAAKKREQLIELMNQSNLSGATPLHVSVFMGHGEIAQVLLDEGAEVNTQLVSNRNTPLYDAINQGHLEIANDLLDRKAHSDVLCINGGNCMHAAAFVNSPELIQKLHAVGNLLEMRKAPHGETPLHIAAQAGNVEAVGQLIKLGATVNVTDFRFGCFASASSRGLTPWHYALFKRNSVLLNVLLDSGALPDLGLLQQPEFNRQYQAMKRPSFSNSPTPNGSQAGSLPVIGTNNEDDPLSEPPAKRARIS